jgi:hypothetical protein
MAALAFVGLVAYPFLPIAPLPQVDFPTIQVTANFQGASAETMAASVAAPLERQFAQIPGVTQLTSLSALGATTIVIQFDLNRNIVGGAGRPGGDHRRDQDPAAGDDRATELQEGQSRGLADHHAVGALRHGPADHRRRL